MTQLLIIQQNRHYKLNPQANTYIIDLYSLHQGLCVIALNKAINMYIGTVYQNQIKTNKNAIKTNYLRTCGEHLYIFSDVPVTCSESLLASTFSRAYLRLVSSISVHINLQLLSLCPSNAKTQLLPHPTASQVLHKI